MTLGGYYKAIAGLALSSKKISVPHPYHNFHPNNDLPLFLFFYDMHRALLNLPTYGFQGTGDANLTKGKIAKAYKLMAMKAHPDRGGNIDLFNKINEAYTQVRGLSVSLTDLLTDRPAGLVMAQ